MGKGNTFFISEAILTYAFGRGSGRESEMHTYEAELITENMIWMMSECLNQSIHVRLIGGASGICIIIP